MEIQRELNYSMIGAPRILPKLEYEACRAAIISSFWPALMVDGPTGPSPNCVRIFADVLEICQFHWIRLKCIESRFAAWGRKHDNYLVALE